MHYHFVFMLIYLTTPASVPTATNVPAVLIEPLQHSVTPRSISLSRVLFSISQILIWASIENTAKRLPELSAETVTTPRLCGWKEHIFSYCDPELNRMICKLGEWKREQEVNFSVQGSCSYDISVGGPTNRPNTIRMSTLYFFWEGIHWDGALEVPI